MEKRYKIDGIALNFWEWINLKLEPWLTNPANRERNISLRAHLKNTTKTKSINQSTNNSMAEFG